MKNFCFTLGIVFALSSNQAFGSERGMPQLNTEFWASQIFWLILIFFSLHIIIWKIFLPKITFSIESRKSKIANDLNEAQKLKESAQKKLEEYEKIIEDSKKEAQKIIRDSAKKLGTDIENKKQKFNKEIEKELLNIEKEIKYLKKTSIPNINKIAIEISSEIIKQMVKTEVNKSNVTAFVEDISKRKLEKSL